MDGSCNPNISERYGTDMRTNAGLYSEDNKPQKQPVPLNTNSRAEDSSVEMRKLIKARPSVVELTNHTGKAILGL